jgi:hypothetical protein
VIGSPGLNANVALGWGLAVAGAASLYLASPHQRWCAAPLPARPARAVALALLMASPIAFSRAMQVVPAVFTFVSALMLLLVLFPYVGAALVALRRRH